MKKGFTRFSRVCSRCNKKFTPTGKYNQVCLDCMKKINISRSKLNKLRFNYEL